MGRVAAKRGTKKEKEKKEKRKGFNIELNVYPCRSTGDDAERKLARCPSVSSFIGGGGGVMYYAGELTIPRPKRKTRRNKRVS